MKPNVLIGTVKRGLQALVIVVYLAVAQATSQDSIELDEDRQAWRQFPEVSDCSDCHFYGNRANPLRQDTESFPRMNELAIWIQKDAHAVARVAVEPMRDPITKNIEHRSSQVLSHRICTELGWDVGTETGYHKFESQCLTCHAGITTQNGPPNDAASLANAAKQPGISCAYCHQVDAQDEWVALHPLRRTWTNKTHAEKEAVGLRNLTSIPSRGAICLDCHLGNLSRGQFVTHAMYVAGHPPLRAFELAAFSQAMPSHWMSSQETIMAVGESTHAVPFLQAQYPELNVDIANAKKLIDIPWETRQVLLASLIAAQRSLELWRDAASGDQWGDYSLYDCTACHHRLRLPSPRQEQGSIGVPGRPRLPAWTFVLSQIAATLAHSHSMTSSNSPDAAFTNILFERVNAVLDQTPFGIRERAKVAADEDLTKVSHAIASLERQWLDAAFTQETSQLLSSTPNALLADYASAQQVSWAFEAAARDLAMDLASHDTTRVERAKRHQRIVQDLRRVLGIAPAIVIPKPEEDLIYRATYVPANFLKALRAIHANEKEK